MHIFGLRRGFSQTPSKTTPTPSIKQPKIPTPLGKTYAPLVPFTVNKQRFHSQEKRFTGETFSTHRIGIHFLVGVGVALISAFFTLLAEEEKKKELSLDELTKIAQILGTSLPEKKLNESYAELRDRCELFCFELAFDACLKNRWKQLDVIKDLLPHLSDRFGKSLLLVAAEEGHRECVEELLRKGIALRRVDSKANNPLHLATEGGRIDLITLLSKYYASETNAAGETALHVAVRCGHAHLIHPLLREGINEELRCSFDEQKMDVLSLAIACGKKECFDALVKGMKNPHFNRKVEGCGNLLHIALEHGQTPIFRHLLTTYYEKTKHLINQGNDAQGKTPLALAAEKGLVAEVEFLVNEKAAHPELPDHEGRTAAHWAVLGAIKAGSEFLEKHLQTIEMLGYVHAKLEEKDSIGLRPEDYLKTLTKGEAITIRNCLERTISLQKAGKLQKPDFSRWLPENLVLPGGGPRGLALLGFLEEMEARGHTSSIRRVTGTSAGAITAGLFAFYSASELKEILLDFKMEEFLDPAPENKKLLESAIQSAKTNSKGPILKALAGKFMGGLFSGSSPQATYRELASLEGLCKGEKLRLKIDDLIATKVASVTGKTKEECKYLTFGELRTLIDEGKPFLHPQIVATQVEKELASLRFNTFDPQFQDVIISDAIIASASIPGIFEARQIHCKNRHEKNPEKARYPAPHIGKCVDGDYLEILI